MEGNNQVVALGKAAYEAYALELKKTGVAEQFGITINSWDKLAPLFQCSWVKAAQAVIAEVTKKEKE